jgi:alpha-beta hydrolase superfamily lysophospholipase
MTFLTENTRRDQNAQIRSVCLVSGVYFLADRFQDKPMRRKRAFKKDDRTLFLDPFDEEIPVGPDFWKSIDAFDPFSIAGKIKVPLLMIHGDNDRYHSAVKARKVFEALASTSKKLKIFKGGDHGITDVPRSMREELLRDIVAWFKKTL